MTSEIDRRPNKGRNARQPQASREERLPNPFVNYSMTDADKAQRDELCPDYTVLMGWLQEALDNGQSISLKFDDYSQSAACFVRPSHRDDENADLVLTARGGSPAGALREALYLDRERSQGVWRNLRTVRDAGITDEPF